MANLILTTNCQRNCSYCFAQEENGRNKSFTWNNFIKAVDFISSGSKIINLIGGEPTLHKDFVKMLEYLIIKDFKVQVFTNGMLHDNLLKTIKTFLNSTALRENQLFFGVNVNEEKYRSKNEFKQQIKIFKTLGKYTYLSFTIQDKNPNLLFLQKIIEEYNLDPTIRLGLALPIANGHNKFLSPKNYRKVSKSIIYLANNSPKITIKLDCGFPLCMFTLEEINTLSVNKENNFSFNCGNPVDVYPDLRFTNCYPLSKLFRGNITDYNDYNQLINYLSVGFMTATGIFKECDNCAFFRKICSGGCKGFYRPRTINKN